VQTAALPGVAAKMATEGFWIGEFFLHVFCATRGRARGGQREDIGGCIHCPARRISKPKFAERMGRSVWVTSLKSALPVHLSLQTDSDNPE
jgi:hypothetical protein